jgi:hypothetical protein
MEAKLEMILTQVPPIDMGSPTLNLLVSATSTIVAPAANGALRMVFPTLASLTKLAIAIPSPVTAAAPAAKPAPIATPFVSGPDRFGLVAMIEPTICWLGSVGGLTVPAKTVPLGPFACGTL